MIGKLRRHVQERGVKATAAKFGQRVTGGYVKEEFCVLLKTLDEVVEPKESGKLRVVDLTADHLPALSELNRRRGNPGADRYFENCLEQGIAGFVAFLGDELVGYYHWVEGRGSVRHPDMWYLGDDFAMEADDVYGSGLYLVEEHRGGGTANDFLFQIETAFKDRGYARLWGYVVSTNRPARWLYMSRGYVITWRIAAERLVFYRRRRRIDAEPVAA